MKRSNPRADVARITQVLADAAFPAAKWQLIMHAEANGADALSRADLWALPAATYDTALDVLAALGLAAGPSRPAPGRGYRPQPPAQAATREPPAH